MQDVGAVYSARYEDGDGDGDGDARLEALNRRNCPASLYSCQTMERCRI